MHYLFAEFKANSILQISKRFLFAEKESELDVSSRYILLSGNIHVPYFFKQILCISKI